MYFLIDLKTYEMECPEVFEFKGRIPGHVVAYVNEKSDYPRYCLLHPDCKDEKFNIIVTFDYLQSDRQSTLDSMNFAGKPFEEIWPTGMTSFSCVLSALFQNTPHHAAYQRWAFNHTRVEMR